MIGGAGDADKVRLFHSIARMRNPVGELTIVRDEDQSLARSIEPPDCEDALLRGHEVDDPRPSTGIAIGRYNAGRLIHREIKTLGGAQRFAIDADFLPGWIDARAQLGDHLAIHFDASL